MLSKLRFALSGCVVALGVSLSSFAQEADRSPTSELPAPYPLDVVVDETGTAFIVDRYLPGVWKWQEGQLAKWIQASSKFRTPLNAPRSIALDRDGGVLVGDSATRDVYRVDAEGKATPITGGHIGIPMDMTVTSDGTIYVADLELRKVVKIPTGTGDVEVVADMNPRAVFADSQDNVWVVSQDPEQLQVVSPEGKVEVVVDHRVFEFPNQVVVNSEGVAFVSDGYAKAIWKVVRGSEPEVLHQGKPLENPVGLTLVEDRLVVVDPRASRVYRLDEQDKLEEWIEIKR